MNCDFSITNSPVKSTSIELKTIYSLFADRTYDVYRTDTGRHGLVAIRTIQGSGDVFLEGLSPLTVSSETLLFFNNSQVQHYLCSDTQWVFWWFEFDLHEMFEFPLNTVIHIDLVPRELNDCKDCLEMLKINSKVSNSVASATLGTLFSKWLMQFHNNSLKYCPYRKEIQRIIQEMKSNLQKPIRVKDMADSISLCERRFRQVFEAITGHSPKKYYELVRNERAEELLKNTSFSILEIADYLGFSSQFHFSKAFSKSHGISPHNYRKS